MSKPQQRLVRWTHECTVTAARAVMVGLALALLAPGTVEGQGASPFGIDVDTVRAGRFDNGRMWTFEYPPLSYLRETYDFAPDSAWFQRARLGALRIPSCSASFVSPEGLVATNHHCAREHVSAVTREGETLLDDGFLAKTLEDERPVEGFEADRLVAIRDVTDEIQDAMAGIESDAERAEARQTKLEEVEARILEEFGGEGGGYAVEMISLYNGGRYSAYVFRRYTDVRLVMAPELKMGFFGGDPDNFTYPRYALDFSFFRVYEDGKPLDTSDAFFPWSEEGVREGELIFVVGNPGSTSRIQTVAELEFRRDVSDRAVLEFINRRIEALQEYYEMDPETAEALDIRNDIFSLLNSQKAYTGIIAGLYDPVILAKRRDAEKNFQSALEADSALAAQYGGLTARMAEIQADKRAIASGYGAFLGLESPEYGSAPLVRALWAFQYLVAQQRGTAPDQIEELRSELLGVPQQPPELEEILIEARLNDLIASYGESNEVVQRLLGGRTPEGAATVVVSSSVLADSAATADAVTNGTLSMSDPAIQMFTSMLGEFAPFQQRLSEISPVEEEITVALGRARFEVYGSAVPPDATFSLRIADGLVAPYEYNGTIAPVHTTFFGLYDRYYSYGEGAGEGEWDLPERWIDPPDSFDLATSLNFVSTADIVGGNSGSPVLNRNLEVVGLAFDGNIESLSGEYIFLTDRPRTVAVDSRGILEAMRVMYGADRLVEELRAGARAGVATGS
ncbi:MAG: S46 family peptidase [Gemmatimonadales bacterium]